MCDQWEKDFLNGKCALGKGVGKADWAALVAPAFFFFACVFPTWPVCCLCIADPLNELFYPVQ